MVFYEQPLICEDHPSNFSLVEPINLSLAEPINLSSCLSTSQPQCAIKNSPESVYLFTYVNESPKVAIRTIVSFSLTLLIHSLIRKYFLGVTAAILLYLLLFPYRLVDPGLEYQLLSCTLRDICLHLDFLKRISLGRSWAPTYRGDHLDHIVLLTPIFVHTAYTSSLLI